MKITKKILIDLGFEENEKNIYSLRSRGYKFTIKPHKTYWNFYISDREDLVPVHPVTCIDELFGCIAEDCFTFGEESKLDEFQQLLKINKK